MFDRMAAWRGSLEELGKSIGGPRDTNAPMPAAEHSDPAESTLGSSAIEPPPTRIETPTLAAADAILPEPPPAPAPTTPIDTLPHLAPETVDREPTVAPPSDDAQVSIERPTLEEAARLLQELGRLEHEAHILRLIMGERDLSAHEHRILADVDSEIRALRQRWRSDTPLHS